jgi:NAD(P)-dependent dehydrogenase (short-subunit alcohol dehydrogenase family)
MTAPPARIPSVALVTGANKGIGLHTARLLGALGTTVHLAARDEDRGRAAAAALAEEGADIRFVRLDVTDPDSAKTAAATVEETSGRLDLLVNNAGVLLDAGVPVPEATADHLRRTYEVNVFGVVTVTTALLPLLRRSPAPRIVNLSSSLGSQTVNDRQPERLAPYQLLAYGTSKAALNAVTLQYAHALRPDGIKVNAVEPGFVATDLNGHSGPGSPADAAEAVLHLALLPDDGPTGTFQSAQGPVPW